MKKLLITITLALLGFAGMAQVSDTVETYITIQNVEYDWSDSTVVFEWNMKVDHFGGVNVPIYSRSFKLTEMADIDSMRNDPKMNFIMWRIGVYNKNQFPEQGEAD